MPVASDTCLQRWGLQNEAGEEAEGMETNTRTRTVPSSLQAHMNQRDHLEEYSTKTADCMPSGTIPSEHHQVAIFLRRLHLGRHMKTTKKALPIAMGD